MERTIFEEEHRMFRQAVRTFVERECVPYHKQWEKDGIVPRDFWLKAGEQGFLCMDVPEEFGGGGVEDFCFSVILNEEFTRTNSTGPGFGLHSDVASPYINKYGNDEQKARWFPQLATGEKILAIAMTEPSGGSDLASMKTRADDNGDSYILNGSKTFITNGINADIVIVACKTDSSKTHAGISLIVLERGMEGLHADVISKKWAGTLRILPNYFLKMCVSPKKTSSERKGMVSII